MIMKLCHKKIREVQKHLCKGNLNMELLKIIPLLFKILLIFVKNSLGFIICSRTCEKTIKSNLLFEISSKPL